MSILFHIFPSLVKFNEWRITNQIWLLFVFDQQGSVSMTHQSIFLHSQVFQYHVSCTMRKKKNRLKKHELMTFVLKCKQSPSLFPVLWLSFPTSRTSLSPISPTLMSTSISACFSAALLHRNSPPVLSPPHPYQWCHLSPPDSHLSLTLPCPDTGLLTSPQLVVVFLYIFPDGVLQLLNQKPTPPVSTLTTTLLSFFFSPKLISKIFLLTTKSIWNSIPLSKPVV